MKSQTDLTELVFFSKNGDNKIYLLSQINELKQENVGTVPCI